MLSFTALNSPGGTEGSNSNSSSFFGSEDGISRHAKRDLMQDSVDDGDDDDNDDDDDDDDEDLDDVIDEEGGDSDYMDRVNVDNSAVIQGGSGHRDSQEGTVERKRRRRAVAVETAEARMNRRFGDYHRALRVSRDSTNAPTGSGAGTAAAHFRALLDDMASDAKRGLPRLPPLEAKKQNHCDSRALRILATSSWKWQRK